jgi:hypothetical protein
VLTSLSSKWLGTGFTLSNIWLIDSGCSRHVTRDKGWFSSLVPVVTKRYITFGDNGRGRVLSKGEIKVSDKITLKRVALVQSLGYKLLSVSQLLDEDFEVLFWPGGSRILDSRGDLVCMVVPEGQVFRADFSQSSGVEHCFLVGSSSELWKWHRKLGHLSFDLLSCLSKLNLVRGLPQLRLEKEMVCAPCRHAKMVASSHPPLTDVMTERPCELLHMDLVGPARVRSAGGKWYVLVVVDDYSRYAWVFFLEDKGETFGFVQDLVLGLRNGGTEMPYEQSAVTMAQNSETLVLKPFAMTWVLNTSFRVSIRLPRMVFWKGKIGPCVRWLGRCLMSIGLRGVSGLRR